MEPSQTGGAALQARGYDRAMEPVKYEQPTITDYGDLAEVTANNAVPQFVDVPQGTPIGPDPVVGSDPYPQMS